LEFDGLTAIQAGGASMANDEHVALLKQGVDALNKWRLENPPEVLPN